MDQNDDLPGKIDFFNPNDHGIPEDPDENMLMRDGDEDEFDPMEEDNVAIMDGRKMGNKFTKNSPPSM